MVNNILDHLLLVQASSVVEWSPFIAVSQSQLCTFAMVFHDLIETEIIQGFFIFIPIALALI